MKNGFTLAEILVTMGVIGIVAAMTMPMLTRNYQFYIRKQQFKKAFAALDIASQKTQIDMGEGVRCFQSLEGEQNRDDCVYFFSEMMKNLKMAQVCDGNALEKGCLATSYRSEQISADRHGWDIQKYKGNCSGFCTKHLENEAFVYISSAGFILVPYTYSGGDKSKPNKYAAPLMLLDMNGLKGPNKWGHDVMILQFYKYKARDSVFHLRASNGCMVLDEGGIYTTTFVDWLYGRSAELQ